MWCEEAVLPYSTRVECYTGLTGGALKKGWYQTDQTRAPTYSPVTKSCRLCLLEKYYIIFESSRATLNVKSKFFLSCPYKQKLL